MVGVINPNSSVSPSVQKDLAKRSDYMLEPGEDFPAEASASLSSISASATPTAGTSSTATSTPTPTPVATHSGLSSGAIAGIAIGGAAVFILGAALFFWVARSCSNRNARAYDARQSTQTMSVAPSVSTPPEMISSGGVLYVPVAKAQADVRHNAVGVSEASCYGTVNSPEMNDYDKSMGINPVGPMTTGGSPSFKDASVDENGRVHRSQVDR